MSTIQRLTLIGLYNYDPTLFDSLELPADYDKQTFIDSLLIEHGEKCILYSNPDFMKYSIGAWGRKWALELERIAQALKAEYDPIYNYDRFEEYTDTEGRTLNSKTNSGHTAKDTPDYSDTQTNNNTDKTTNAFDVTTEQNTNGNVEHQTSAYNSSSYEPEWKEIRNDGKTTVSNDGTITDLHTGTIKHDISGTTQDLTESANSTTDDKEDRELKHTAHLYGNVGVTTSAQMVTEVLQQRFKYNLYGTAAKLFANELLIGIY